MNKALTAASVTLMSGLLAAPFAMAAETVQVDGSSTVFPITEAIAEEFQKEMKGDIRVTVGVSGTGGGFKKFCHGETAATGASRPIKKEEAELCKQNGIEFIELPVSMDALTVVIHPDNDWAKSMTVEELKKVWEPEAQGKITNWNQIRSSFPDKPLRLYGAGTDSGTYDYFTAAIVGKEHSSRGDFTASEDDNVLVQGVANDPSAMGFFGLAYYEENKDKLDAVAISWKGKEAVLPSVETAGDGSYQPLSRPIFMYASKNKMESEPHSMKFMEYYLNEEKSAELVEEVGYVPMSSESYQAALRTLRELEVGTAFTGSEIGVNVVELLGREKHY
ncbi:PstS family phosphate ABC transporter substrate-binding protein [Pseudomonas sp. gcc21]|uniref:PstS family phosphate ABC transporter substrate-binding protein n=1 Tax=Pseudomonas sp. gcc21 TaxID=2726989 RepID=UPI00145192DB|nr:PstS family phosphate ABC transporter substrate-binding protein [Pseudomonas sp. gcc21]QJD59676.1 PstS family phosphate ABC transporter substrate-binding protein [Pseudomonas sp. gcc21]